MNEQLQKQLAELLAKAQDAAMWAGSQIPPLVQEKIVFGRAWETLCLVLLIVGVVISYRITRWGVESDNEASFFGGFAGIAMAGVAIAQTHAVLMVWFAPRLYIVEWLRSMIQK